MMTEAKEIKMRGGKYMVDVLVEEKQDRIFFAFKFNNYLKDEIKAMQGAKWHGIDGGPKLWSVKRSARNLFQLEYLMGGDPYAKYDAPLDLTIFPQERFHRGLNRVVQLFAHTPVLAAHLYQRGEDILAGEMGIGKSISAILAIEQIQRDLGNIKVLWIAPRSALKAVERECYVWDCRLDITFLTYEGMTSMVKKWDSPAENVYDVVIFDESSKLKNAQSQRSQAAMIVADAIRDRHGPNAHIMGMTGTPSPKNPTDWYSQSEIMRPGYIREGDIYKFKNRLAVIVQKQDISGGTYPQLVTWRDSDTKCARCGIEALEHADEDHDFVKGVNEVAGLYERLKGLVMVKFKKDCLDLPDKVYRKIVIEPSPSLIRTFKTLTKTCKTAIQALSKGRELSDGFQYVEKKTGTRTCEMCNGTGIADIIADSVEDTQAPLDLDNAEVKTVKGTCPNCGGEKVVDVYDRKVQEIPCPKDDVLVDLLDEYDDVGRVVIYAGFTASIDRCVKKCLQQKWAVIRVDQGKDTIYDSEGNIFKDDYLNVFQDQLEKHVRVAFVAHPKSAGMGLTLTASPVIIYYSNDFDAEARIQSEDRIHRAGMDVNRGATIIDIVHLPTDQKVLDNLQKKRDLQAMTMGELADILERQAPNGSDKR